MTSWALMLAALAVLATSCASTSRVDEVGAFASTSTPSPTTATAPAAPTTTATTTAPGTFRDDPHCSMLLPEDLDWFRDEVGCGWLVRPAVDDGDVDFELPVAIFSSRDPTSDEPPIVFLHGGPGSGVLAELGFRYYTDIDPLLDSRDVILFDQRGSGQALPTLDCRQPYSLLRDFPDLAPDVVFDATAAAMQRCVERAEDADVDLEAISLEQSALDVAVLARELGHDEIIVVGVSWGGLLASHVTARFPTLVKAAVLDSPLTPQTDLIASMPGSFREALDALDASCQRDVNCADDGDLTDRFEALVAALDERPAVVELVPWTARGLDERQEVEIDGGEFADLTFGMLYNHIQARHLPDLITDLERGDTRSLARRIAADNWGWFWDFRFAVSMCNDMVGRSSPAAIEELSTGSSAYDRIDDQPDGRGHTATRLCEQSGLGARSSADLPLHDVPTLILAGTFDPITPLSASQDLAASLPRGRLLTFDGQGHGVRGTFCADEAVRAFIALPEVASTPSCSAQPSPEVFPDHALSVEGTSVVTDFVATTVFGSELTVQLDVPSTWQRDFSALGNSWFRNDGAIDLTGISVLVDSDEGTAVNQRRQWTDYYFAEPAGTGTTVQLGPTSWERRLRVSANGIAIVSYEAPASGVAVVLLAYPEEIEAIDTTVLTTVLESMQFEVIS